MTYRGFVLEYFARFLLAATPGAMAMGLILPIEPKNASGAAPYFAGIWLAIALAIVWFLSDKKVVIEPEFTATDDDGLLKSGVENFGIWIAGTFLALSAWDAFRDLTWVNLVAYSMFFVVTIILKHILVTRWMIRNSDSISDLVIERTRKAKTE